MPYVYNDGLTEEERQRQAAGGQPQATGGGDLLGAGGAPVQGPVAGATPSATSSGWTNLRSYLDANKEQAGDLAGKVSQGITQQGDAARGAVDTMAAQYNADVSKGGVVPDQNLLSRAAADPAGFEKNPQDVEKFKTMRDGVFSGPSPFEQGSGYQGLLDTVSKASDQAKNADTEGGREQLVKNLNPNMTAGQSSLNNLLLSGDPNARGSVVAAAKPYAGLRDYLGNTAKTANEARGKAVENTAAVQKQVQDNFIAPQTKTLQDIQGQITGRVNQASQENSVADKAIQDLQKFFETGDSGLTEQEKKLLGIWDGVNQNDDNLEYLKNSSAPSKYVYFPGLAPSSGVPTAESVAAPDEYARILALQDLLGTQTPFLTPDQLAMAGTYRPAVISKFRKLPSDAFWSEGKNLKPENRFQ